jgi:hypothetical protein
MPSRDRHRERLGRDILRAHARTLAEPAPSSLRDRCLTLANPPQTAAFNALGVVAIVTLAMVGSSLVLSAAEPGVMLTARLVADHGLYSRKAIASARLDPASCARAWKASHGWEIVVPSGEALGLTLVGLDRCQLAPEDVAHLVYRNGDGRMLSLFIQPNGGSASPVPARWLGQTTKCWESCSRAYTLISSAGAEQSDRVASVFRRELDARTEEKR